MEVPSPAMLNLDDGRTIAYHSTPANRKDTPGVIFLGGFMSDMTGTKATALDAFCREKGYGFTRFDYTGHGASSGKFREGTIGGWAQDALDVLNHCTRGPQVLVGSSMGGWIMLLAALQRPERIHALVGIAAAPDFTEDLIWGQLSEADRNTLMETGVYHAPSCYGEDPYPITRELIEEARQHLLLRKNLAITCPVRLIQGMRDDDVPWQTALTLNQKLESEDVQVTLVKHGDHRMSSPEQLALLGRAVAEVVEHT